MGGAAAQEGNSALSPLILSAVNWTITAVSLAPSRSTEATVTVRLHGD